MERGRAETQSPLLLASCPALLARTLLAPPTGMILVSGVSGCEEDIERRQSWAACVSWCSVRGGEGTVGDVRSCSD